MGAWIEICCLLICHIRLVVAPHDGCVDWNDTETHCFRNRWKSHPTMGAWIEIGMSDIDIAHRKGSHPTMGAWIEIDLFFLEPAFLAGRTPRWVRGLKCTLLFSLTCGLRRTPRWVRGLKYVAWWWEIEHPWSHPTMGAWIEIRVNKILFASFFWSHPTMGAWIEILISKRPSSIAFCRTPRWVRGLKFNSFNPNL